MKKVLFLIESMVVGGAEKVLLTLVNNLNPEEYDVTVVAAFKCGVYGSNEHQFSEQFKPHVKYRWLFDNSSPLKYKLFSFLLHRCPGKLLHRMLIGTGFDVEVAFYEGFPTMFLSHSSNQRSRKVAWLHTDAADLAQGWDADELERQWRAYSSYDQVVAVSSAVAESFVNILGNIEKPVVCHNPIDVQEVVRRSHERCEMRMPESNHLRLISVGRLCPVKAYDRLLRVVHRLIQQGIACELWLVGAGESFGELEAYVNANRLEGAIKLLGFQENPYPFMRQCDLFVCSSLAEGFSTVVCEALSLGLPVISTACAGMTDLLGEHDEFGVITENSEEGLFDGLEDLLSDAEKLEHYKEQAFVRAKGLGIESSIERIMQVLSPLGDQI